MLIALAVTRTHEQAVVDVFTNEVDTAWCSDDVCGWVSMLCGESVCEGIPAFAVR